VATALPLPVAEPWVAELELEDELELEELDIFVRFH